MHRQYRMGLVTTRGITLIPYWAAAALLVFTWCAVRAFRRTRHEKTCWRREVMLLFLLLYALVVLRFAFFPYNRIGGHIQPLGLLWGSIWPPHLNVVPFVDIFASLASSPGAFLNLLGNVALFVPAGMLLPCCFTKLESMAATLQASCIISVTIELLQLIIPARVTDVNDVILNVIGSAIGYGILTLCRQFKLNHTCK